MKKIASIILVVLTLLLLTMPAYAINAKSETTTISSIYIKAITERGEVTEWVFRINNGILEMRLWSVTYGKWLTEWMPAPV